MRHIEEDMQISCVRWFEYKYKRLSLLLHHSPNGGKRNAREGARFKAMGTRAGFPDLMLCVPCNGYHALFLELKTKTGKQQASQKQMQEALESVDYKYVVCHSMDEFISEINDYLKYYM